ncbi:MAG: hypothetical protein AB1646_19485 [Thermodesulfobacteriota bacterium]
MTNSHLPVVVLGSLCSILGIWCLYFWLFKDYMVDRFRQDMFRLRDTLFDFAAAGAISFDHPAYGLLRRTINGFIRFAHLLSLPRLIVFAAFGGSRDERWSGERFAQRWSEQCGLLDEDVRGRLTALRREMEMAALRHAILLSPVLSILLLGRGPGLHLFALWFAPSVGQEVTASRMKQALAYLDRIDAVAASYGGDHFKSVSKRAPWARTA